MPDPALPTDLFRFTCPHCKKVLKARTQWAGRSGICPNCKTSVQFPAYTPPSTKSRTAQQLIQLIADHDNLTFDDNDGDRLSMLLSQATCRDFALARKLLDQRPLSPRQWRRLLSSAAARESMRLRIEEQLERIAEISDDDEEPTALLAANEVTNPDAWKIIARFLYYLRHDTCEKCQRDPTGLSCIYLTVETFLQARQVSPRTRRQLAKNLPPPSRSLTQSFPTSPLHKTNHSSFPILRYDVTHISPLAAYQKRGLMKIRFFVRFILVLATALSAASSQAAELKKLLVVTTTAAFRHDSIPTAEAILEQLSQQNHAFTLDYLRQPPAHPTAPKKPRDNKRRRNSRRKTSLRRRHPKISG